MRLSQQEGGGPSIQQNSSEMSHMVCIPFQSLFMLLMSFDSYTAQAMQGLSVRTYTSPSGKGNMILVLQGVTARD